MYDFALQGIYIPLYNLNFDDFNFDNLKMRMIK